MAFRDIQIRRLPIHLEGDDRRVIARPFILGSSRVRSLFERIGRLSEDQVHTLLREVESAHASRHEDLRAVFDEHYNDGKAMVGLNGQWSNQRRLLAGAYLTMEYAVDSAALFNPSIVPHPDQRDVPAGGVRILMSLRATGEGHVSSIVFRTGIITANGEVQLDPLPATFHRAKISPDRYYLKTLFAQKLKEMGLVEQIVDGVLDPLPQRFALGQLVRVVDQARPHLAALSDAGEILRTILWLASSNYHIDLEPAAQLSELVIFPMSEEESHGIEDLRLVRFVDDDGSVTYYGTYNAYNGLRTLPMLMHTTDFRRIEFASLNGSGALNKGMALFPRRIDGWYVMCTRIDGENLYIATSHSVHFWDDGQRIAVPRFPWEYMQIGNCGSALETDRGWLLLTHGVGPMRTYAIGAMLLDLNNPLRVIGHLRRPLITPAGSEREGYVPNVVYTCGAMIHRNQLFIPYATADKATTMAVVDLPALLDELIASPVT